LTRKRPVEAQEDEPEAQKDRLEEVGRTRMRQGDQSGQESRAARVCAYRRASAKVSSAVNSSTRLAYGQAEISARSSYGLAACLKGQAVRAVPLQAFSTIFRIWNFSYWLLHAERVFGAFLGCCTSWQPLCLDPVRLLHSLCFDLSRSCGAFFLLFYHSALHSLSADTGAAQESQEASACAH